MHVILIHYPLAMLSVGVLIELFAFLWRGSTFRTAGRWMILIGSLFMVPVAMSGIYALFDAASAGQGSSAAWIDVKGNLNGLDWAQAKAHILYFSISGSLALVAAVTWIACTDLWRRRLHFPLLFIFVVVLGLNIVGAWHGGEMVYRRGFGVEGIKGTAGDISTVDTSATFKDKFDAAANPTEIHIITAGFVFALAAVALGLSLRQANLHHELLVQRKPVEEVATDLANSPGVTSADPQPISVSVNPAEPDVATVISQTPPKIYVSRYWLLAALLAVGAIIGGFYIGDFIRMPHALDPYSTVSYQKSVERLKHAFSNLTNSYSQRMAVHIIFGGSILVLTLILAIFARWAPRSRGILAVFSGLLVLIMAGQVWVGILMLYDSPHGKLTRFQTADDEKHVLDMLSKDSSPD
jgi:uncharacterized membrane protein